MTGLFADNRKIFVLMVSMFFTTMLNRAGLDANELLGPTSSTIIGQLAEGLTDLLIIGGIPAVLTWAQPNEENDTILRYWRAVVVGVVAVLVVLTIIWWLG